MPENLVTEPAPAAELATNDESHDPRLSTGLRKPVDTLAMVPKNQRINPLARKAYFVLMWFAQQQGWKPGQEVFRAPLQEFLRRIGFNSNNTAVIKAHLAEITTTKVEWQSPTNGENSRWGVSGMLADAEIIVQKGEAWLEWSYSSKIRSSVLSPDRFANTTLEYQAALKAYASLALYDICARYANSPTGLTARQHWTWWRPVLTGTPEDPNKPAYSEYKFFYRDIIKTALIEVSRQTNLDIELVTHKIGRKTGDLQFRVRKKKAFTPPLKGVSDERSLKTIGRAIAAGVSQKQAELFLGAHGETSLALGVDTLEGRKAMQGLDPIQSPERYLDTVLNNQTIDDSKSRLVQLKEEKAAEKNKRLALLDQFREDRRRTANALFDESNADDQKEMLVEFEMTVIAQSAAAVKRSFTTHGVTTAMVRALFLKFLAEHFFGQEWDTPDANELLIFSLS